MPKLASFWNDNVTNFFLYTIIASIAIGAIASIAFFFNVDHQQNPCTFCPMIPTPVSEQNKTVTSSSEIMSKFQSNIITREKAIQIVQDYINEKNITPDVNTSSSQFRVEASLMYVQLSTGGFVFLYEVDPNTGMPTQQTPFNGTSYYKTNPKWWIELEKSYLGISNNRSENGYLVWDIDYRDCNNCIAPYPMFLVDAITSKVIFATDGSHRY